MKGLNHKANTRSLPIILAAVGLIFFLIIIGAALLSRKKPVVKPGPTPPSAKPIELTREEIIDRYYTASTPSQKTLIDLNVIRRYYTSTKLK